MYSYVTDELRLLIDGEFNVDVHRVGIFGHSMGGHGALTIALKNPEIYKSVSAFAPISSPMQCPWGEKVFLGYLGTDKASWSEYDATELVKHGKRTSHILIDQGGADQFLSEQLKPEIFEGVCRKDNPSPFGCRTAMITAIISSRPSWKIISAITPPFWRKAN